MRFVRFSVRQAVQGFWRNRGMNVAAMATMAGMLILLAALLILITGVDAGLRFIESKVEIRAELNEGLLQSSINDFMVKLEQQPEVAIVRFVSKDEALADFRRSLAERGQEDLTRAYLPGTNPLPAYVAVELRDPRQARATLEVLDAEDGVVRPGGIVDPTTAIERLVDLTAQLRYIGA